MTLKLPQPDILDIILKKFGKKRAVFFPTEDLKKHGKYSTSMCKKENFFISLFRSKNDDLPEGTLDIFEIGKRYKNYEDPGS